MHKSKVLCSTDSPVIVWEGGFNISMAQILEDVATKFGTLNTICSGTVLAACSSTAATASANPGDFVSDVLPPFLILGAASCFKFSTVCGSCDVLHYAGQTLPFCYMLPKSAAKCRSTR